MMRKALLVATVTLTWVGMVAPPARAAVPTISSFSPTSGPVGAAVVISGTGFTGTSTVTFNGTGAAFTIDSDAQITATVPTGATTGPIAVTNAEGTAASSSSFTVTAGSPECSFDAGTATAAIVLASTTATIDMVAGTLEVDDAVCTGATARATDTIVVTGTASGDEVTVDLREGPFMPGATDEGDASPEIEISLDLGAGSDAVRVLGRSGKNFIVVGSNGINLNATEASADADVSLTSVESVELVGGPAKDILWAAGSYGTNNVTALPVTTDGQGEDDIIGGGNANDVLDGSAGWDDIRPFGGNDKVNGGDGYDLVFFQGSKGIHADLGHGVARGQGRDRLTSMEDLWGGRGDDVLIGSGRPNYIWGLEGHDVVKGEGNRDHLFGGTGPDLLRGGAGNDIIDGEDGTDTCYQDAGRGKLTSCEKRPEES